MESILSLTRISRRRRNILLACCALGAGGYFSYRVCTSASVNRKQRQLYSFFHSLLSLLEATAKGSDCVGVFWKDLHSFLLSNEDEVPQTLKQLFKVGQTREFQTSVALLCSSVTQGVASGLSGRDIVLHDESDYGSALFEELSFNKEGGRKIAKLGRNLGHRESREGRHSRERRWRSSGETDVSQFKDLEEDYNCRGCKLDRSESASRIDGGEDYHFSKEDDEAGKHSSRKTSRSYQREKGLWAGVPMAETGGDGGKGKGRAQGERRARAEGKGEGLPERIVGKLFSEAGRGFASAVVASAVRSLVHSVLEGMQEMKKNNVSLKGEKFWSSDDVETECPMDSIQISEASLKKPNRSPSSNTLQDGVIDFLCSSKGRSVIADCIETFTGTAVSIYLDKTRDVNVYEDILATVSKPAHREPVKELLTAVCNGAVETLVRTSHEVMSVGASSPSEPGCTKYDDTERSFLSLGTSSRFTEFGLAELGDSDEQGKVHGANDNFTSATLLPQSPDNHDAEGLPISSLKGIKIEFDHSPQSQKVLNGDMEGVEAIVLPPSSSRQIDGRALLLSKSTKGSQGWIEGVSRTLAVPSNRALVLDVAGTVTAEAVRSAIEVVANKISLTLRGKPNPRDPSQEGKPSTSKVLHVISKTGELAQVTAAKAMVAMTMCLAICLHTLVGPSRVLQLS